MQFVFNTCPTKQSKSLPIARKGLQLYNTHFFYFVVMCMWNKVSGTQHDTKAYDELKEEEKINIITKFVSVWKIE